MTKEKKLVIVGTGEFALLADQYFSLDSEYDVVAFSAERSFVPGPTYAGRPVVPLDTLADRFPPDEHDAFVATSARTVNRLRTRLFTAVKKLGYRCATYVSSTASVWPNVELGENCLVGEGNVVQAFVTIGDNVYLHSGNAVGHRTVIEDHCFVSAHVVLGGFCRIGRSSFVGLNATFNDRTGVSADCIVGSGSLVSSMLSMPERVYHGAPAMAIDGLHPTDIDL